MLSIKKVKQIKPFVFILLLLPGLFWFYQFSTGSLGINPIEKLMDKLGETALRLIILTLFISSLSDFKYFRSFVHLRRMIGLYAFFYVMMHFTSYVVLDHFFDIKFIIKDILKRPFITFGFISFIFLIPLALTSTNNIVKKLGFKLWKRIHYLIYPAAILSSIHFYMLVRANKTEPLIYITIILILLFYRFLKKTIFHQ
tara:strand:- start:96 stop:692 length:597 start_codon:yes stop_codon:yes gene_type:complete